MNIVRVFHDLQRIYGFCPCCGEPFRLSDADIFYRAAPRKTAFDALDLGRKKLLAARDRLDRATDGIRERAREHGRKEGQRRLRALTQFFGRHRLDMEELKAIFHPVDYIAFRGLSRETCSAVEFIDRMPISRAHERLQRSIHRTLQAGDVAWYTVRIGDEGGLSVSQ